MTWVKMDDRYPDHPKVAGLTDGAFRLWTTGIAYCSRHLSDGQIPETIITRWGVKHPDRAASELVSGGLWRSNADGYEVVNYLKWQRSRAEIEALSAKRSEAGKKGAKAKHDAGKLPQAGQDVARTVRPPESDTESDTESSSSSVTARAPAGSDDDAEIWHEYATLKANASPSPVGNFDRWSVAVIDDAKRNISPTLTAFRNRWPDATPAELARLLFDGTLPAQPPKPNRCGDCGRSFPTLEARYAHDDSGECGLAGVPVEQEGR